MTSIESKIKECLEPIINGIGYRLYDVIYEKEGKDNYLRIFIDSEQGISLNDCENVNNNITEILDEKDFIKAQYFLEVSSTGVEKRIRTDEQLKENIGQKIEIHTFEAVEKNKSLVGILKESNDENIVIEITEDENANLKNSKKQKGKKDKKNSSNKQKEKNSQIDNDSNNANNTSKEIDNINENKTIIIKKSNISNMKTVFNWEEM